MRSPSLHTLAGLPNQVGLSNYLSGQDDSTKLLRLVPDFGFSALCAGPTPPNAAELLSGNRVMQLIRAMQEKFDHIIFDSPPVMGLADALLIGARTDGTIFVVESHGIRARMVRIALERLAGAQVRLLGSLLTKFDAARAVADYGYHYGYGYGEAKTALKPSDAA